VECKTYKQKENKVCYIGFVSQSSALYLADYDNAAEISFCGNWSINFNTDNKNKNGDNSVVDVEVDFEKKTIYYFINNDQ
jgi:hypothetical protein